MRRAWTVAPLLALAAGLAGCASEADKLAGNWNGALKAGPLTLGVAFHLKKASGGTLTGTLDSPMQRANGIPIDQVSIKDGKVHFQVNKVFGTFDGTMDAKGTSVQGTWSQGPASVPLTLTKT